MFIKFTKASVKVTLAALAFFGAAVCEASANEPAIFRPEKRSANVEVADTSKSNNVILNVDIFGDMPVGSYYIFWNDIDLSDEMKKLMTTREFAKDEFFMQNIDREQFEQERMLMLFEDQKREFFRIYPEELLKQLEEEKADN